MTEQRIAVPGTSNLRDGGGYRVADGAVIARRRLYRAEAIVDPGGQPLARFVTARHRHLRIWARRGLAPHPGRRDVPVRTDGADAGWRALRGPVRLEGRFAGWD